MRCPHCSKEIHFEAVRSWSYKYENPTQPDRTGYAVVHGFCPSCENLLVMLEEGIFHQTEYGGYVEAESSEFLFPKSAARQVATEVPPRYAADYREAASIVSLSPKASAALCRRVLQQILREEAGVPASSLAREIQAYIQLPGIPSHLSQAVDAIRNIGNFAAHPLKDTNTGEVVDVEPGEGGWLLDVLDALFDFHFVQPERLRKRRELLDGKLKSIGKPPMK
jgi:hypothetical protein